ncbi:cytochrome P450 [Xylariaceae sp. FL0594]|nr:cytochrome P450 [Xylariaceae sp. FL0594]
MAIVGIIGTLLVSVPQYALAFIATYVALYTAYQVFLHPLSKYPGPFWAKLSDAYGGFYANKKCVHLVTRQNQLEYGPVIRQGPNKLVFCSVSALRDIYNNPRITKPKAYIALGPGMPVPNVFTAADKHFHRTRRQLISQILTDRSLHKLEPVMTERVDIFLDRLSESARASCPVNMSQLTRRLTMDIAGLLGFGFDLNLQRSDENSFILTILDAMVPKSNLFYHFFTLRRCIRWLSVMFSGRMREKYMSLMEKIVSTRMAESKDARHDLYSVVADVLDAETGGLRQSELWAEANFFLTAAGETSKTAICATLFYLSRNPEPYQKLATEIRTSFTSGTAIHSTALNGCRYLRACIDEALRMSPPAPGILWREEAPGDHDHEPLVIDGHVIPPGVVFGVSMYCLHHNEEYFPDSFTYNPDRWLQPETQKAKMVREAFAPFSVGPRACPGKSMAYQETNLVIAKMLWYFDFQVAPGNMGQVGAGAPDLGKGRERAAEFQLYDVFNASHDGPYLTLTPRGNGVEAGRVVS